MRKNFFQIFSSMLKTLDTFMSIKGLIILCMLLVSCRSITYVKYDKDGYGRIKSRTGITSPYNSPNFRGGDLPAKQKKWRIKRSKRVKS